MKYYLIAGEASGDLHGSNLLKGLKSQDPEAEFRYWGGDMMESVAPGLVHHYREGAVMGISDTLEKAGRLLSNLRECKNDILKWRTDVVILIDYPGFNMKVAGFCHSKGIKVFYYIAPKTWASRSWRNRRIKKWVDRLYIVFPFETSYFESKGIPFTYKGNPLLDAVDQYSFSRPADGNYIALLPGSRKGEISRMMPACMEIADKLKCKVLVAGAPGRTEKDYGIDGHPNVELMFGRTYDILKFADAAIVNSGTASLEAALIGTPQVVCWSTSKLTAFVAGKILHVLKNVKYISLGNLIVDRLVFKEYIQDDFKVPNVLSELSRLCGDKEYREEMKRSYAEIRSKLGGAGASDAIARAMIDELKK